MVNSRESRENVPDPVFCPECRSEYLATATVCVECDVALIAEGALRDRPVDEMPPISELVCIRASSVGWAQALSQRLAAAGISHRIEVAADDEEDGSMRRPGANLPFGVYVRPEDAEAAAAVDAEFMQYQIPDLPAPEAQAGAEAAADCCPACGASTAVDAQECSDCGLALL